MTPVRLSGPPWLDAVVGQLGVGADGQDLADAGAHESGEGGDGAVTQLSALLEHAGGDAEVHHAGVQQAGAAEQDEDGDLAPAGIVLDQEADGVGALGEGEVAEGVGTGLELQPLDDDAVDLDLDEGRAVEDELAAAGGADVLERADGRIGPGGRDAEEAARALEAFDGGRELPGGQADGGGEDVPGQPNLAAAPFVVRGGAVVVGAG